MLVVSDLSETFLPAHSDILVNLQDAKTLIDSLMSKIPKMCSSTQITEIALGSALKAAFEITV